MRRLALCLFLLCISSRAFPVPPVVEPPTGQHLPGKFVWFELVTADLEKTTDFYGQLLGWEFATAQDYTLISYDGERLGGVVRADADEAVENLWVPSLSVADVDAALKRGQDLGASVDYPVTNIPGRGEMAVITDPQGAALALLRSSAGDPADGEPLRLWAELWSARPEAALEFYQQLADYKVHVVQSTAGKRYWVLGKSGQARAGVAEMSVPDQPAIWVLGLAVRDLHEVLARGVALGGTVLSVPSALQGPDASAVLADPMGGILILEQRDVSVGGDR